MRDFAPDLLAAALAQVLATAPLPVRAVLKARGTTHPLVRAAAERMAAAEPGGG